MQIGKVYYNPYRDTIVEIIYERQILVWNINEFITEFDPDEFLVVDNPELCVKIATTSIIKEWVYLGEV